MKKWWLLFSAALAFMPISADAQDELVPLTLEMTPGRVRMFRAPEKVSTVVVGNETTADVTVVSDVRVAITARKEGSTTMIFLGDNSRVVATLDVTVIPTEAAGRNQVTVRSGSQKPMTYLCKEGCRPSSSDAAEPAVVVQSPATNARPAPNATITGSNPGAPPLDQ